VSCSIVVDEINDKQHVSARIRSDSKFGHNK